MDDAFCGGGDLTTPLTSAARAMVKAAIFMGDPRHIPGLPYNVGTCNAKGVGYCFITQGTAPWCQGNPSKNIKS